jgi:plasmid stability protein
MIDRNDMVVMTIRLPRDLHEAVRAAAAEDQRSIASWVRRALEAAVESTICGPRSVNRKERP